MLEIISVSIVAGIGISYVGAHIYGNKQKALSNKANTYSPYKVLPSPPPIDDPLKSLVQLLIDEDGWEYAEGTFTHPTGVRVIRRTMNGGHILHKVCVENQVYDDNFAKASFIKLFQRRKVKEKAIALKNLVQKVIDYNEKDVVLGEPELESGIQSLRLEHQPILETDQCVPPFKCYDFYKELSTRPITNQEFKGSINRKYY